MKFRVEAKPLAAAMGRVSGRSTIPILSHVHIAAADGAVSLTTTNLDVRLTIKIAAEVAEAGTTTTPIMLLRDLTRRLDAPAELETADKLLTLRSGRGRFRLPTLPAEDYPREMRADKGAATFSVPAADLLRLLDRTLFVAAIDGARHNLCGVYFRAAGERLRAVATDSYRIAQAETTLPPGAAAMPGVIIPHKTAEILLPFLAAEEGTVELAVGEHVFRADLGDAPLPSKLIEAKFPDYQRVVPTKLDTAILTDAAPRAGVIERVALLCDGKTHIVTLTAEEGARVAVSAAPIVGGGEEEVEGTLTGTGGRVAFNSRYALDCLRRLPDTVWVEFTDIGTPIVLRDPADDGALYLVTLCRV
jgi:DNA polymerase-3 subunit beta